MAAVENSTSDSSNAVESNSASANINVSTRSNNTTDPDFDIYAGDNEFAEEYETRADGADLYDDVIAPSASDEILDSNHFAKGSGSDDALGLTGADGHGSVLASTTPSSNLNHTSNHQSSSSLKEASSSSPSKRISFYIGNLSWWTTDIDVLDAITSVGVTDASDVKFFENRANGQSKGFCVVSLTSDASFRTVMEKLPKIEIHGQNPVVTPCNRQSLNHFEMQSKKQTTGSNNSNNNGNNGSTTPSGGNGGGGISTSMPVNVPAATTTPHHMAPSANAPPGPAMMRPQRLPYPPSSGPAPGSRPPLLPTMPNRPLLPSHPRGQMPQSGSYGPGGSSAGGNGGWPSHPGGPRGPPPPHAMVRGGMGHMQRPRVPGGGLLMPPGPPSDPGHRIGPMGDWNDGNNGMNMGYGMPPRVSMSGGGSQGPMGHGGHPSGPSNVHLNPAFIQGGGGNSHPSPNDYRGSGPPSWSSGSEYRDMPSLSEAEVEEIYNKNRALQSSSIQRAIEDVTEGNFTAATDTLVTAISLIKQSKISHDERCKLLISSLQDALAGVEAKAYNSSRRDSRRHSSPRDHHHRDRMDHSPRRSPRSRSPKRSRRSRSRDYRGRSRDRNESSHRYRASDDYDSRDSRDSHRHRDDRDRRDRRH